MTIYLSTFIYERSTVVTEYVVPPSLEERACGNEATEYDHARIGWLRKNDC